MIDSRYRLVRRLGQGGSGEVFLVEDTWENGALKALKQFAAGHLSGDLRTRFVHEFRFLKKLRHPNLVKVFDFGTFNGQTVYYTSEYVDGQDLVRAVRTQILTPGYWRRFSPRAPADPFMTVLAEVCRAVEYVHAQGVIHGDLKPNNILLTGQHAVKLLDFGLARARGGYARLGASGTLEYLAPEVLLGEASDHRSDLYSLGVVLYQMATGHLPFGDIDPSPLVHKQVYETPPAPCARDGEIPPGLSGVVMKLLAKDPMDRFSSANEVIAALNQDLGTALELETRATEQTYILSGRMVGRQKETAQLRQALTRLQEQGQGAGIFISGESGVGKTRLKAEFKTSCQTSGLRVYSGHCYENKAAAFRPFLEILPPLAAMYLSPPADPSDAWKVYHAAVAQLLPNIAPAEPPEIGGAPVRLQKEGLLDSLAEFLVAVARKDPMVIFLDDLQWADDMSVELLHYLLNAMADAPLLICGDFRSDEIAGSALERFLADQRAAGKITEMALRPLSVRDTAELIRSMFGKTDLAESFVERIHREAGGNPFYMEESIKALVDEQIITKRRGFWEVQPARLADLNIPETVAKAFLKRVQKLDAPAQSLLRTLALLHRPTTVDLLLRLSGIPMDQLMDILVDLEKRQIVTVVAAAEPEQYFFRHIKMKEVLYRELDADFKRAGHQRVGEAMEAAGVTPETPVEDLAYHFTRGQDKERAMRYALQAAAKLQKNFYIEPALDYYKIGLKLLDPSDTARRAEVHEAIGDLLYFRGDQVAAQALFEQLLADGGAQSPPGTRARIHMKLGKALERRGAFREAIQQFDAGLRWLELEPDLPLRAEFYGRLGFVHLRLGEYAQATQFGLLGLEQVPEGERGLWSVDIYNTLYGCSLYRGEYPLAMDYARRALAACKAAGHMSGIASAFTNIGVIFNQTGPYEKAIQFETRAMKIRERMGDKLGLVVSYINLANPYGHLGRHTRALELLDTALRTLPVRQKYLEASIHKDQGYNYFCLGRYQEALDSLAKSTALADEIGSPQIKVTNLNYQARLYLTLRQPDRARPLIEEAVKVAETLGSRPELGQATLAMARCQALLNDAARAESAFQQAIETFRSLQNYPQVTLGLAELAGFYHARGRTDSGLALLDEAVRLSDAAPLSPGLGYALITQAHLLQGERPEDALQVLLRAAKVVEAVDWVDLHWKFHYHIGSVYTALGSVKGGEKHYRSARDVLMRLLPCVPEALRAGFLADPVVRALFHAAHDARPRFAGGPAMASFDDSSPSAAPSLDDHYFQTLFQISKVINSMSNLDDLFEQIIDMVLESVKAERGFLLVADPVTGDLRLQTGRNAARVTLPDTDTISMSIVNDVLRTARPVISTDASTDPRLKDKQSILDYQIKTVLCAPIKLRDSVTGVIYLDNHFSREHFTSREARFLDSLSNLFAITIENARLHAQLRQENIHLKQEVKDKYRYQNIVGNSARMQQLFRRLDMLTKGSANVLIYGESGTGKELVARAIHYNSDRRDKHFIPVDCGAIPEDLMESELFGHKRGSFTGALCDKEGLFESAHGGTIFLDEIANLKKNLQPKLLRVLQEREVRRIGETISRKVDVRVIAASNRDLKEMVDAGEFRPDLYYRLNIVQLHLPPLRERKEDVPLLAAHFLRKLSERDNQHKTISVRALRFLQEYPFPGNVRELENIVESAFYLAAGPEIGLDDLPDEIRGHAPAPASASAPAPAPAPAPDTTRGADPMARALYDRMVCNKESFWAVVKAPFMARALTTQQVREVIRLGLQATRGRYKDLVALFNLGEDDYKPLMNFLRKSQCQVDFREFRN